jgi:hypothetical protein
MSQENTLEDSVGSQFCRFEKDSSFCVSSYTQGIGILHTTSLAAGTQEANELFKQVQVREAACSTSFRVQSFEKFGVPMLQPTRFNKKEARRERFIH